MSNTTGKLSKVSPKLPVNISLETNYPPLIREEGTIQKVIRTK